MQPIVPEPVQSDQQAAGAPGLQLRAVQPAVRRYNPDEAAEIVSHLTSGLFDPEYILLFGSLVGGTSHSDAVTYDLLMVVRKTPAYDWLQAKRYLRCKMPCRHREITYINLYIMQWSYVESNSTPFLYFARSQGELLYCSDRCHFRCPKHQVDIAAAYADAKLHFDTFRTLGNELSEQARYELTDSRSLRLAAQFSAQAMVYFYYALYAVYHGQEFDSNDPVIMHDRMRTLSTRPMLTLEDNHIGKIFTLPCLKRFLMKAPYGVDFDIAPRVLEMHMERVERAGELIETLCGRRLELYKMLSEQQ